ncbi:unnamed protein product, partial [Rotaria socialis]
IASKRFLQLYHSKDSFNTFCPINCSDRFYSNNKLHLRIKKLYWNIDSFLFYVLGMNFIQMIPQMDLSEWLSYISVFEK